MTEKDKAPSPGNRQGQGLSRRDLDLARLEKLLAESCLPPEAEEDDENIPQEAEEVDPAEAIEIAKLPPKVKTEEAQAVPPLRSQGEPPAKTKGGASAVAAVIKTLLLLLALAAIFVLGLAAGRGHIWKSGAGQDLIIWIEQNSGLAPKPARPKKPAAQEKASETAPEETAGESGAPSVLSSPDEPSASAQPPDNAEDEVPPVWDWQSWTPDDSFFEDGGEEQRSAAPPASQAEPGSAAEPAESSEPSSDGTAASEAASDGTAASETASDGTAASESPSAENQADDEDQEEWPTAIEPDQSGLYSPPSDQEPEDYEAMLQPSEVPDASYAEATPLPPAEISGSPGLGKFAVQVEVAANEAAAKNTVDLLTQKGFQAYHLKKSKDGYAVRVGHFATRQDADKAKLMLEDLGYEDSSVAMLSGTGGS